MINFSNRFAGLAAAMAPDSLRTRLLQLRVRFLHSISKSPLPGSGHDA